MNPQGARPGRLQQAALGLMILLALVGAGIGIYMTGHHDTQLYGGAGFELVGCSEAPGVSCDVVNTSEWSEVFGVPTFTWAVPTYLLVALLAGLAATGRRQHLWSLLLVSLGAVGFSAWLYYVAVVELGVVCSWCIRLYAINGALLLLSLVAGVHRALRPAAPDASLVAAAFALLAAISVGAERAYRSALLADAPELPATAATTERSPADDPEGPAPEHRVEVQTEDGNQGELIVRPTDAWKGNPEAEVVLVEFADFECGYCKRASGELRRLYEAYSDRILFVFKHFPMDPTCNPGVRNRRHRDACSAAVAATCAQEQGRFWAFHDLAFKNQHELDPDDLRAYAEAAGLDPSAFDACVRRPDIRDRVVANGRDGAAVDAHGTPRIFIDGKLYRAGSSAEQMARAIELALGTPAREASTQARSLREETAPIPPIPEDVPSMRRVQRGDLSFEIDTFEASLDAGVARSGKHEVPATRMSWFAARDACQAAGKRMCTEAEWITACQGAAARDDDKDGEFADDMIEGSSYPYGDYHERGRCWDGRTGESFRPVYTGELPGCASADGVYDMTGNIEEWVGRSPEEAVLLGGAWDTTKDHARCYRRNDTFGPGYANPRTGVRCCR